MKRAVQGLVFLVSIGLSAAALSGCAVGTKITQQQISQIQRGKTTKAEITKLFGEPRSVMSHGGGQIWTYDSADPIGMLSGASKSQSLMITFAGDRVKDYQHTAAGAKLF